MIKEPENTNENANQTEEAEKKPKKKESKEVKELKEIIKAKETELSDANDKYLRLLAEYDNFKKRSAKEKTEAYTGAKGDAVSALLPVFDNLDRALQYEEGESMKKGIELILKQFADCLSKLGIEEIKAEGEKFNPDYHYAVFHDEKEGEPENTVTEVLQKGYKIGDRVIRYAMVKVIN